MNNGMPRFYKIWNRSIGPNYFFFDRLTHEKVGDCQTKEEAETKIDELNRKDREERGLPPNDEIETSSDYYGSRHRETTEVKPVTVYK